MRRLLAFVLLLWVFALPAAAQPPSAETSVFLENGRRLAQDGDYSTALLNYTAHIGLYPDTIQGYIERALIRNLMGEQELALADINAAMANTDSPRLTATLHLVRGEIYIRMQDIDQTLLEYQTAIDLVPDYAPAYRNRGIVYDSLQDYENALADYSRVLEITPDDVQILVNRARVYLQLNQPQDALSDFDSAVALDPEDPELVIIRARLHHNLGNDLAAATDYLDWLTRINESRDDLDALTTGERISETVTENLTMRQGKLYAIPITATTAQKLSIVANSSGVDPLVVVLDPAGNPIISDDDSGFGLNSAIFEFVIPEDGNYTLLLGHARGGSVGIISLTIALAQLADV